MRPASLGLSGLHGTSDPEDAEYQRDGKAGRALLKRLCAIADLRPFAHVVLYRPLRAGEPTLGVVEIRRRKIESVTTRKMATASLRNGIGALITSAGGCRPCSTSLRKWFTGAAGTTLHFILALAGFALTIWGFVEIGCLRGTAGPNKYGANPPAR